MEQEVTEDGVSIADVFRTVKRRMGYILGAAVLFAVAVALILAFAVNPTLATYSMDFRFVFPSDSFIYPDGSPFFYQDITSREFLSAAKNSSEAFSGIDVDKMYRNGDIEIEAETSTENDVTVYTGRYTVKVKGAYFKKSTQAEEFIGAVAHAPIDRMRAMAEETDYTTKEEIFNNAPFEERIALLTQEKENLLGVYDRWIAIYSATYAVKVKDAEYRLKDCRDSVTALFGESVRENLNDELEGLGGYYGGDLDAYRSELLREYGQNRTEIGDILTALGGTAVTYAGVSTIATQNIGLSERLTELFDRNRDIAGWLGITVVEENGETTILTDPAKGTLNQENIDAFADRLSEELQKLNGEAKRLTDVVSSIYSSGMSVRFDAQKVSSSGGTGVIIGAVIAFVGGLIIGIVVAYIVESNRKKNAPNKGDGD